MLGRLTKSPNRLQIPGLEADRNIINELIFQRLASADFVREQVAVDSVVKARFLNREQKIDDGAVVLNFDRCRTGFFDKVDHPFEYSVPICVADRSRFALVNKVRYREVERAAEFVQSPCVYLNAFSREIGELVVGPEPVVFQVRQNEV